MKGGQSAEPEGEVERAAPATDPTRPQVLELVPALPFEDDPSSFLRLLDELAETHGRDDER